MSDFKVSWLIFAIFAAALIFGGIFAEDYFARQEIEAKAKAQRAINTRKIETLKSWRGSSVYENQSGGSSSNRR